jgi:RNA polymerase sigma factor (sigma-70 family)
VLDTEAGGPSAPKAKRPLTAVAHLGLVYSYVHQVMRRRHPKHLSREDLVQEGFLGLMRGLETFDPSLGFQPSTYLRPWVKHFVDRAFFDKERLVRVPVYQYERARANPASLPTNPWCESTVSLDAPAFEGGADPLESRFRAPDADPEGEIQQRLDGVTIDRALALAIAELPERLQRVIRGRSEGQKLVTIGAELGLSRERIRQLEIQALGLLREKLAQSRDTTSEHAPRSLSNWRAKRTPKT